MRKSVSAGWVEKLVESWLRFQNNYRHSVGDGEGEGGGGEGESRV